jgi:beta-galactosidase
MTRIRSIGCIAFLAFFAMFGQVVSSATNLSSSGGAGKHRRVAVGRLTLNFNSDWKFTKSDPSGASTTGFDDRSWIPVSLPHTYNDTDTFDNWSTPGHRGEQIQWGGRTWYRKPFTLPLAYRGKKVFIEFEGVRQVGEVYLNGHLLGVSKTGFTPFGFDLTPYLRFGTATNVLAVMCDNRFARDPLDQHTAAALAKAGAGVPSTPNPNLAQLSAKFNQTVPDNVAQLQADQIPWNNPHWHPAHGGIYRNVRLYIVDPLHIDLPLYSFLKTVGPYVYATEISSKSATTTVEVPVTNGRGVQQQVELNVQVLDASGQAVLSLVDTKEVPAGASTTFKPSGKVANPRLWEPDYPYLYRVVCTLRVNGSQVDTTEVPLGIRTVRWDLAQGFFINGQHLKLHGWGQKPTDEWPGLGAALPDWMHFYTIKQMRDAGGNFIRWGHSAAGPSLIAASDRLGLIIDQPGVEGESDTVGAAWKLRASAFRDTLIYFRNNPSILIWEGGNQKVTHEHARELRSYFDQYDPHGGRVYAHRRPDRITAEFMDVQIGTEGGREIAGLPVVEGEYDREESPRRVWDQFSPPNFGYPEAKGQTYQLTSEQYAVNQVSQWVKKLGAVDHSGGANWIFSDSTSGGRVAVEVARASGEVDGVRLPKDAYYVCAAMFRSDPQVHIIGHWTYPAGTKKTVYVASNAEDVELFVNGKSLGHGKRSDNYLFTFADVSWEPGEIKAVASSGDKTLATDIKRTVGPAVALRLTPITGPGGLRADGSDILLVDVEAVDANGERCPTFQQRVDFTVNGPATWRGGYNSGKLNSINNTYLDLEAGINRVAIRAGRTPGKIMLTARSSGLNSAALAVTSSGFPAAHGFTTVPPSMPAVVLPAEGPVRNVTGVASLTTRNSGPGRPKIGRFTETFNYSGPSSYIVYLETGASDGKNAYVDIDSPFIHLPSQLVGADWIKAAARESLYSAVDLIQVSPSVDAVVAIAHDERLARPAWLTSQFQPTELTVNLNGRRMLVFERRVNKGESLTLGANTEDVTVKEANMYVVFISAAPERN